MKQWLFVLLWGNLCKRPLWITSSTRCGPGCICFFKVSRAGVWLGHFRELPALGEHVSWPWLPWLGFHNGTHSNPCAFWRHFQNRIHSSKDLCRKSTDLSHCIAIADWCLPLHWSVSDLQAEWQRLFPWLTSVWLLEALFLTRPWPWALSSAHLVQFKQESFWVSLVRIPYPGYLIKFLISHPKHLIISVYLQQESCEIGLAKSLPYSYFFLLAIFPSTDLLPALWL